jgi:hypothetical protein
MKLVREKRMGEGGGWRDGSDNVLPWNESGRGRPRKSIEDAYLGKKLLRRKRGKTSYGIRKML